MTEKEYRADEAISYSKAAKFAREGVKSLKDDTKVGGQAVRFGSLVDSILTGDESGNYVVIPKFPSEVIINICEDVISRIDLKRTLFDFGAYIEAIQSSIVKYNYGGSTWKADTKLSKVIEEGREYFNCRLRNIDRILIDSFTVNAAKTAVNVLKSHPFTSNIFHDDVGVEIFKQIKFKGLYNNIPIKCMLDILKVDHVNKTIQPYDLKTTTSNINDFKESVDKWKYLIQSRMYCYILEQNLMRYEEFRDYAILPFQFIVIDRNNNPLLYRDRDCFNDSGDEWKSLVERINWHINNNEYIYTQEAILNNGVVDL